MNGTKGRHLARSESSMESALLANEYPLTRTARAEAAQPPSGVGPKRVTGQAEAILPPAG